LASLSRKAALLIIANAAKYAVGFVLPMIVVRFLTRSEYGTYQQLSLVATFATGVMVLGLPTSIYYFYHRASVGSGRATLIAQTQIMLLISGCAASLAITLAAPLLAVWMHNPELRGLLPWYSLYIGLFIGGEHFLHVMISQNRYGLAVGLELAETVVRVAALVAVLVLGGSLLGIVLALAGYAAARLIVRSYWIWRGLDSVANASWAQRSAAAQLAYGLPLAATVCIGVVGGLLDRAIVAVVFNPAAYAVYSVGALEVPLDSILQASVLNVLRASLPPLVSEGRIDEVIRVWRDAVRKLALIVVPSFVFLALFAERFITTLFTESYGDSVAVFRIYVMLIPLHMLVVSVIPQVYGRTRLNLYVVASAMATNVVLSFVLLHFMGILGPATALVCSQYLSALLYFIVTVRLLRTRPRRLLPIPALARTALASLLAVGPALFAAHLIAQRLISLTAAGAIFAAGYLLAAYLLGVFRETEIQAARAWLRRLGLRPGRQDDPPLP
jgi:O-antigen/teichoic acid export membrane protein